MTQLDNSRQLSEKQLTSIPHILIGKSDEEVANEVGVTRQTVNNWRNHDPDFIAELNLRRQEIWDNNLDRMRQIAHSAIDIIEDNLDSKDEKVKREAAYFIAKQINLSKHIQPKGETNPNKIKSKQMFEEFM